MFGLLTRRQLEKILDERELHQKRALEEMAFEWARWFDKFRSLYAQWVKRDAKHDELAGSAGPLGGEASADASGGASPPPALRFPNSRRGF